MLVMSLMKRLQMKCDEVVKAKRSIEQRMVDDIRQYNGSPRIKMSKQDTTSVNRATLEPPRIHATRSRTDALESRLCDMLFPTNDHPWDLVPTPDDEWESDTSAQGQPTPQAMPPVGAMQPGQPAQPQPAQNQANDDAVTEACARMKKVIQDQLSECQFTAAGRRMVRDACRYGFGVLCGPVVTTKVQRRFSGPNMEMQVKEVPIPSLKYCDPFCFYPDMVPDMNKAEFVFYLNLMSARELQELATHPGFNPDEIKALLREDPDLGELKVNLAYRNNNLDQVEPTTGRYSVWRYTGALDLKDMKVLASMFPDL